LTTTLGAEELVHAVEQRAAAAAERERSTELNSDLWSARLVGGRVST